ncbi:putative plastid-lipid-associated protein [Helianthus annuus]|nr:putative plastid-lipid-associated protein [Helianthus annuus]KAJ0663010.1 putative plastid-lipid-associated protein [Helianthus annuus]
MNPTGILHFPRYYHFWQLEILHCSLPKKKNSPLLKLERICQNINTRSSTIENSITFSTPFANFTSTTFANFEVRSPYRIQLEFKERIFQPPKIKSNIDLPENLDIFGRNINLSPVKQSLNPLQEAVANIAGIISGQAPVKVSISRERTKSWLITYLDKDLRVAHGVTLRVFECQSQSQSPSQL